MLIRNKAKCVALSTAILAFAAMGSGGSAAAAPPRVCDSGTIVAQALPAIVNITVVKVVDGTDATPGKPDDARFDVFVGSGAVIDPSEIIVTNKHVIEGAATISVTFHDKSELPAQLIAAASFMDLAVLKVNMPRPLAALQFGDSDAVQIGQPVTAVGNPLGLGTSVSTGVVSALDRDLKQTPFDDFIQTDASINPGNSGGPLLDCAGNIIGIDTALVSNNKVPGSIGIGFALPSNDVKFVAAKLLHPETASPNWIGLRLQVPRCRWRPFSDGQMRMVPSSRASIRTVQRLGHRLGRAILSFGLMASHRLTPAPSCAQCCRSRLASRFF